MSVRNADPYTELILLSSICNCPAAADRLQRLQHVRLYHFGTKAGQCIYKLIHEIVRDGSSIPTLNKLVKMRGFPVEYVAAFSKLVQGYVTNTVFENALATATKLSDTRALLMIYSCTAAYLMDDHATIHGLMELTDTMARFVSEIRNADRSTVYELSLASDESELPDLLYPEV